MRTTTLSTSPQRTGREIGFGQANECWRALRLNHTSLFITHNQKTNKLPSAPLDDTQLTRRVCSLLLSQAHSLIRPACYEHLREEAEDVAVALGKADQTLAEVTGDSSVDAELRDDLRWLVTGVSRQSLITKLQSRWYTEGYWGGWGKLLGITRGRYEGRRDGPTRMMRPVNHAR